MQLLFILLLGFCTIFQSYFFYFYRDDFALLYNLQHNIAFPYPYWFLNYLYLPIFLISKTQPLGFTVYNSIFYFLSIILFYFWIKEIFTKKIMIFLSTIIFTVSPIGIVSLEWLSLGATQYFSLCLLLLILLFYIKFQKTNKKSFGLVAGFFYVLSLELMPLRAFTFIIPLFFFELLFLKRKFIKHSFFRLLPFFLFFLFYFLIEAPLIPNANSSQQIYGAHQLIEDIFDPLAWYAPFQTTFTVLYGGILVFANSDATLEGMKYKVFFLLLLIAIIISLMLFVWKKNKHYVFWMIFSLGWMYFHILGYNLANQPGNGEVVARYNTFILPAFALFWSSAIFSFYNTIKRRAFKIIVICSAVLFLIINFWSTVYYFRVINITRSQYVTSFYKRLRSVIPSLPNKHLLFYMESSNLDAHFRLFDFTRVGIYDKNASFATFYKINEKNIILLIDKDELTDYLNKNKASSLIYAISYDGKNIKNISSEMTKYITGYSLPTASN